MGVEYALSMFTTVACLFGRLPQIFAVLKAGSVAGISKSSLLLEFWSYFTTVSYSVYFGYDWSLYAEYPPLLIQDLIIYLLIILQDDSVTIGFKSIVPISLLIHSLIGYGFFPQYVPVVAFALSNPIGILSKIIQLVEIIKNKDAGNVSALSWFLNFLTGFTRFLSIYLTVFDLTFMAGLFCGMILNLSVALTAVYYNRINSHKHKKL